MQRTLRLLLCGVIVSAPLAARAQEGFSVSGSKALAAVPSSIPDRLPDEPAHQADASALAVAAGQEQANGAAQNDSAQQSSDAQSSAQTVSSSQAPAAQSDPDK